jgi:glycosyltransferase involved in cell wall biosynthesis
MYPPHHTGGYEIVWEAAMRRAVERGHEVLVLTTGHREAGVDAPDEPHVRRELEWYWEDHEWRRLGLRESLELERHNASLLERHVERFRPDAVSFWSMGGMSLSMVERVARSPLPSLLVIHDGWLVYAPKADRWMNHWRGTRRVAGAVAARVTGIPARFRRERSERVLANSEFILDEARGAGYSLPDAAVVHPGIDREFLRDAPPTAWGWRLLYVGRLDRRKGVDLAIEALARLPEQARMTVAGSGDHRYEAELRDRVAELALTERVDFAGQIGRGELPALYSAHDVLVFPVRWEEPFGLVPLEAMGVGRPVVATARGGAADYLRDGENALTVPTDDPDAIAAAVRRLSEDEGLRTRLRTGGTSTAAAHTAAAFEDGIVDAHEEAAGLAG